MKYKRFSEEQIIIILRDQHRRRGTQNNMVQMLLNHDWAHRWEYMLNLAGISPSPQPAQRRLRLSSLPTLYPKPQ